jgi:vanillate O-demethylase ferredoxin subunit
MSLFPVKVAAKSREAEDIVSFELRRPDGQPLPAFSAGAHIDVQVREGMVRQYSLCNAPWERHRYVIGVLREPASRGGSVALHDKVAEADILHVSEPRNLFPLVPADHALLLAGGIGVTPLLCMAEQLSRDAKDFAMHYCTRSLGRTAFHARIAASRFASKVQFHVDDGPPDQKLPLDEVLACCDAGTHLYVCGPTGFIGHVLDTASAAGWPGELLHSEYFTAVPQEASGDQAFSVKIASTGQVIVVAPGQTVTSALAKQGIDIPVSCEQGICGTCITGIIDGIPDHRDMYFTDMEREKNDQFTPCCSRSKGRLLVLNL